MKKQDVLKALRAEAVSLYSYHDEYISSNDDRRKISGGLMAICGISTRLFGYPSAESAEFYYYFEKRFSVLPEVPNA